MRPRASTARMLSLLHCLAPVLLAAAELPHGVRVENDVSYVTDAHPRQKLDVACVENGPPQALLVWIHGGAFAGGDKAENQAIWGELLQRGYAVATINYRLSGDATWPAQISDCKAAIRFLRARATDYRIDPAHIGVWGSSAGGHLAALVGASGGVGKFDVGEHLDQSSAVQCAVDLFGPIDFESMPLRHDPNSPEARMWGGSTAQAPELAREASPLTYLSKATPPFLIFHGGADTVVQIEQSRLFQAALQKAGATSELVELPGVGHSHVDVWMRERERILAFFDGCLKGGAAPGRANAP